MAARLQTLDGRLPRVEDREHAFALACTMALADGVILESEKAFVAQLATALRIDEPRANEILGEVLALEPAED